jgi:Domain of unknown function (DUF4382)
MKRFFRTLSLLFAALAALAGFGLVTSCNIAGGGGSGARGSLNLLLTDGPTDDWQEVSVVLKSISLYDRDNHAWEDVWTADPANPGAGKINLVDLSGVAQILAQVTLPVGIYGQLKLVIDTDPMTMELVTDDGTAIDPANIKVVDPSGKGEIKVDLDPAITVAEGQTTNLQVDFDLAHPLSIVNLDGKVVISLKVRHKALPRHLRNLQFARTIGKIKTAATDGNSFVLETLQATDLTFNVNIDTIYVDADTGQPGTFVGLSALAGSGAALVASNMNADGSFYARRVWYAASVDTLPVFSPEGLVRRVGDNWISILKKRTETLSAGRHRCDWNSETIFVNDNTAWTFRDIAMGTGPSVLRYIARGFRVEVTLVDAEATPKVAASINVHSAHAEGLVTAASLDNFSFGWRDHLRTMTYSGITDHAFGWWFYGLPSGRSAVVQDFVDTVTQARSANLWVFAFAGLYWDAANTRWVVEDLVLAPMKLHEFTRITTGYTAASGTMGVSTYDCWDVSTPVTMTIALDTTGNLQTVVGSFVWNALTNVATFTLPVLPSEWEALLTPAVNRVKIWVRPVKATDGTFSWHANTVLVYQFVR